MLKNLLKHHFALTLPNKALTFLKSANKADLELSKLGPFAQSWQGCLIIPAILAFLYFHQKRSTDSLKFLLQSQTMIQNTKEAGLIVSEHMETLTNLLTFMVLWKIGRYQDASKYIFAIPAEILKTSRNSLY